MKIHTILAIALSVMCSLSQCHAVLVISAGEHTGLPGEQVDIPIFISGPDGFLGVDLAFAIGDGGSVLGGSETIQVTVRGRVNWTDSF